jgi:hypothetical protein
VKPSPSATSFDVRRMISALERWRSISACVSGCRWLTSQEKHMAEAETVVETVVPTVGALFRPMRP